MKKKTIATLAAIAAAVLIAGIVITSLLLNQQHSTETTNSTDTTQQETPTPSTEAQQGEEEYNLVNEDGSTARGKTITLGEDGKTPNGKWVFTDGSFTKDCRTELPVQGAELLSIGVTYTDESKSQVASAMCTWGGESLAKELGIPEGTEIQGQ